MTAGGEARLPESLGRALDHLRERIPPLAIDRLWLFPVLQWENRETGVIVVTSFREERELRGVHTLKFQMARIRGGRPDGASFEAELEEEGIVPADRLHRIIAGVGRRFRGDHPGEPEEVDVGGKAERLDALVPPRLSPERSSEPETTES